MTARNGTSTPETFTCEECGRTLPKAWSDEEMQAEAARNFGDYAGPMAIVCDDCYGAMGFGAALIVENDPALD